MGQILHGSATTTEAVRRAIQHSQASLRALAKRCGINPKTVAKWKKRGSVADLPTGPKDAASTVLSVEEEAVIVAFRRHTLLPLDDCLYALQPTIPHLTRSSLHRCLQRHGVSRLPEVEGKASPKRKFKAYPIGYFHIDIAEVRRQTLPPRRHRQDLEVRLCRTPRDGLPARRRRLPASADRGRPLQGPHGPYRHGTHFPDPAGDSWSPVEIREMIAEQKPFRAHAFEYARAINDIDHRLTKPKHPWTNGQVERMNRTIKDATVKRYFYESNDQLRTHLRDFVSAYNFARRLKTLKGLPPYEFVCKAWTSQPQRFKLNPLQQMQGLNTQSTPATILTRRSATHRRQALRQRPRPRVSRPPRFHHAQRRPATDRRWAAMVHGADVHALIQGQHIPRPPRPRARASDMPLLPVASEPRRAQGGRGRAGAEAQGGAEVEQAQRRLNPRLVDPSR